MSTIAAQLARPATHPVDVHVAPQTEGRNRLTTGFRIFLAIPHLLLVGGPLAAVFSWTWNPGAGRFDWGAGGGVLGAVAAVAALIAWFSIVFTGRAPGELWECCGGTRAWRRTSFYSATNTRRSAWETRDRTPRWGSEPRPAGEGCRRGRGASPLITNGSPRRVHGRPTDAPARRS
jgi:hypothetical protein